MLLNLNAYNIKITIDKSYNHCGYEIPYIRAMWILFMYSRSAYKFYLNSNGFHTFTRPHTHIDLVQIIIITIMMKIIIKTIMIMIIKTIIRGWSEMFEYNTFSHIRVPIGNNYTKTLLWHVKDKKLKIICYAFNNYLYHKKGTNSKLAVNLNCNRTNID